MQPVSSRPAVMEPIGADRQPFCITDLSRRLFHVHVYGLLFLSPFSFAQRVELVRRVGFDDVE